MTQEKQLLLKCLCAMLPYDTIVSVDNGKYREDMKLRPCHIAAFKNWDIKPYLRPLESMTEEERAEYFLLKHRDKDRVDNIFLIDEAFALIDWLNKKCFDYRGFIEKGVALEAPKGMYE